MTRTTSDRLHRWAQAAGFVYCTKCGGGSRDKDHDCPRNDDGTFADVRYCAGCGWQLSERGCCPNVGCDGTAAYGVTT